LAAGAAAGWPGGRLPMRDGARSCTAPLRSPPTRRRGGSRCLIPCFPRHRAGRAIEHPLAWREGAERGGAGRGVEWRSERGPGAAPCRRRLNARPPAHCQHRSTTLILAPRRPERPGAWHPSWSRAGTEERARGGRAARGRAATALYCLILSRRDMGRTPTRFHGKVGQSVRLTRGRSPVRAWVESFFFAFLFIYWL
jgi:hypothetical protein